MQTNTQHGLPPLLSQTRLARSGQITRFFISLMLNYGESGRLLRGNEQTDQQIEIDV
jgi:hypothetical protein